MQILLENVPTEVLEGTKLLELAQKRPDSREILLAKVDGKIRELYRTVYEGESVHFLTADDKSGFEAYRKTLTMVFLAACDAVCGEAARTTLHFSLGDGYFFTIGDRKSVGGDICQKILLKMREMMEADLPIVKERLSIRAARALFTARGMADSVRLFETRRSEYVNVYRLGVYVEYSCGVMGPSAGCVPHFALEPYEDGVLLLMPGWKSRGVIRRPKPQKLLFANQREGEAWAEHRQIGTVGELNRVMVQNGMGFTILGAEADQERRLSEIAGRIAAKPSVRFVLVAGPSSSGKTTFSQRLCVQLLAHGVRPHYIGVDNYFIDRDLMPLEPDGTKDFESIRAIALDVFSQNMESLLLGEEISLPKFDFVTGRRVDSGQKLRLGRGEVLVIEGIHCLNPMLTASLPSESIFKIYISALTQLNIDPHNHIPSSDGRLLRRIIRDHRTRGYRAGDTLKMWEAVRRGEEKNIFPYQEEADAFFNSALPYEAGVLKAYVEPLLFQVGEENPCHAEARRLLKFLDYFLCIPAEDVPTNSILREFIGGGIFRM